MMITLYIRDLHTETADAASVVERWNRFETKLQPTTVDALAGRHAE